jgi:hypothetical protein
MNDYVPPPPLIPLPIEAVERQEAKQREDYAEREKRQRREALTRKQAMAQRYDPDVMVVIEYVNPEREKNKSPIIWDIEGAKYGFWRNARKTKGLGPWQERVPASAGLPRTDNLPRLWKLIYDPRDTVPETPSVVAVPVPTEIPPVVVVPVPTEIPPLAVVPLTPIEPESDESESEELESDEAEFDGLGLIEMSSEDEDEYNVLCSEILIQRGPKAGQIKKSATPEQAARYEQLRAIFATE